tara:strand:+ start:1861 stop:2109 length:249 start_codon:yes stop_codon:yes gene_type:complete
MLEFTRKNYFTAFLFHAIYSSIIFGTVFLVNDYLDEYFTNKGDNKYKKTVIHVIVTFFATLLLVLLFWYLFGWGAGFTPPKK